ncbi:MAG TPA: RNA methyltransferase substrate-binding domain-containing protein, partial [Clostridiales bacterium]|nr:RNA methyltransferase substrate-binding domain-containing protein [Clostridiales bacterium]
MKEKETKETKDELIIGRNPVLEALKAGRNIDTLYLAKGERQGTIRKIASLCRDADILVKEVDSKKLDYLCGHANHQGVIARIPAHAYATLEDLFDCAEKRGEPPFFII